MNRMQRIKTRRNHYAVGLNETARMIDRAIIKAGIPAGDRESFVNWAIGSLWNTFKEERMNQRMIIENEIRR